MDGDENKTRPDGNEQPEGSLWLNLGKVVFLIAALAVSWFVLEWLIEGK